MPSSRPLVQTPRHRLLADRAARWVVTAGGLAIIVAILGILVFILAEVWPLTAKPRVTARRQAALPPGTALGAIVADEHRTAVAGLAPDGRLLVVRLADGKVLHDAPVLPDGAAAPAPGTAKAKNSPVFAGMAVQPQSNLLSAATRDGRVALVPVSFDVTFAGDRREVTPNVGQPVVLELDPDRQPLGRFAAQVDGDGQATAAAEVAGGKLAVVRRATEENMMTGEKSESLSRFAAELPAPLTALVMDGAQSNLFGGTADGEILWWTLAAGEPGEPQAVSAGRSPVTALTLLIGGRSLIVGQADGSISVWFPVRQPDDTFRLTRIRDFPHQAAAIDRLVPSPRDKGFFALDRRGGLGLYYSTSHRTLWRGRSPLPLPEGTRPPPLPSPEAELARSPEGTSLPPLPSPEAGVERSPEGTSPRRASLHVGLFYTPKADALLLAVPGRVAEMEVWNPHPEVSARTLFGKVWYEGYPEPAYVWQSTGGSDDFEPKLSLTPLLYGTLKGTFYSLLLAIPLGVFGAMYASQFMHPDYKRVLKPMIEIMASLPSVVLGFLAGLWLAPRLEAVMPSLLLMAVVLPLCVLATGALWQRLPRQVRGRFRSGTESILFVAVLALGIWGCLALSPAVERLAFGGSFQSWLLGATGLPFDQRNAVVVGLAMGFAVIPIIFAIAEDAFSNVPRNLVAGSLALGADRWQTVTRVVLPTASPGIFSGVMIGFGRAVGETMIVLMATGNTPIMEWNPFNGFRTLSANIAVEIPEAPHGGTLYRMLFLAGLLLFVLTFIVNTAAELVRQRLRERYSQL